MGTGKREARIENEMIEKDNKIEVFINSAGYSEEEQKQMIGAINAFKEGKDQPEGRFKILGVLPKED